MASIIYRMVEHYFTGCKFKKVGVCVARGVRG